MWNPSHIAKHTRKLPEQDIQTKWFPQFIVYDVGLSVNPLWPYDSSSMRVWYDLWPGAKLEC